MTEPDEYRVTIGGTEQRKQQAKKRLNELQQDSERYDDLRINIEEIKTTDVEAEFRKGSEQ